MARMTAARQEAKEAGRKHYVAAKPCRNGHKPIRLTSSGECVECRRLSFYRAQQYAYDRDNSHEIEKRRRTKLIDAIPGARVFLDGKEVKNVF